MNTTFVQGQPQSPLAIQEALRQETLWAFLQPFSGEKQNST